MDNQPPEFTSALAAGSFVESGADAFRQFDGIVVGPEVEEKQPRLLLKHVAVDCGHLDPI
jgi:hypothetical protein